MNLFLVFIFFLLWGTNGGLFVSKRYIELFFVTTCVLLFVLMCVKHNVPPVNGVVLDHFYYEQGYQYLKYSLFEDGICNYYLFLLFENIGHSLKLTYVEWGALMMALSLALLNGVLEKFKYNKHEFLFYFMFFVIALYASLKQYFGFCVFVYAISFLVRNLRYDKLKFIVLLAIASGFHIMYYFYFIFIFVDNKIIKPQIVFLCGVILFALAAFANQTGFHNVLIDFSLFFFEGNSKDVIFSQHTNFGFLIPVTLHLASLLYVKYYVFCLEKDLLLKKTNLLQEAERLYSLNLLCVLFYPLYLICLPFTRLVTIMSLTNFMITSKGINFLKDECVIKLFCLSIGVLILFSLYFYGPCRFYNFALVPFFTIYPLE